MNRDRLFRGMISDCPTQYLSSYQIPDFDTTPKKEYVHTKKVKKPNPPPFFVETLTHMNKDIPFDLFWNVKDSINRFNPWTTRIEETRFVSPETFNHAEVIRTRPRLVVSPALAIDDITDPDARKIVTDDTYISTWSKEAREAVNPSSYVKAPLPTSLYPPETVSLPHNEVKMVSPEWRMHSCSWEGQQVRSSVDKNTIFWSRYVANKRK